MEEKKKGSNVVTAVWEMAEPLVTALGLTLWDVRYVKEGANRYLRIIIDKEGGVNINDCVAVNDAVDAPLDELDPIPDSYSLQVCSAGIERELVRDFHFERYIGAKIILKLRVGFEGKKIHRCVLTGYNAGEITVTFADGTEHTFEKNAYSSVKLDDFDENF
ncbi:MAG: ribosome maturation factor RimP [Clostridia bacterium]|nr:ribosome maturation factor RimP [Clostridia bacterium]MBR5422626.1 ribosome maturation factor RimP [Clostridia bacterium]